MCGIAGVYNLDGKKVEKEILKQMAGSIAHRGPDDEGFYVENNVGLTHRRLSIIDLSDAGHQPMTDEKSMRWIVFNGEIYNYIEIREELKKSGYKFRSGSDTEVILGAYDRWGENCVNKFNGMWAFAIWDSFKKELFCSRDRFGEKPFYYYCDGKRFAFSSEIKSLLSLGMNREANGSIIYDFIKYGMLDHTNDTFFKNIKKLPPASNLKVDRSGIGKIKNYWNFEVSDELGVDEITDKEVEEFLELFLSSIKLRLRSDVPIGSCLSGGLDSSSIVCVVNSLFREEKGLDIGKMQKTFSSCFENKRYDEREYIEEVIRNTGAEKNYIFPELHGFLRDFDRLLWHQEEPFAGAGIYSQWKVMEEAKNKVKVLFDGQGADEMICGYRKFYIFLLGRFLKEKKYVSFISDSINFFISWDKVKGLDLRNGLRYFSLGQKIINPEQFFNPGFSDKYRQEGIRMGFRQNLGQRIKEDITKWSLPVLLRYEDKNSMAHGIESRLPFLDYRLVEKIASMPVNRKISHGWTKYILRQAMKGILPEKIRLRKSKLGFATPEYEWLKSELWDEITTTLNRPRFIRQYVNEKNLEELLNKPSELKKLISGRILFQLYVLERWGRKFILNDEYKE